MSITKFHEGINEKDFNQTNIRNEKEYSLDKMSLHSLMFFIKLAGLMVGPRGWYFFHLFRY
jgi:hypothetical protein